MNKSILLLGSTGMLGQALYQSAQKLNYKIVGVARTNADINLDITNDIALTELIEKNSFTHVINTCAIVNHELCEKNKELAYCINARPSSVLSNLSLKHNFKYIFISTDGFYTNETNKAHTEEDTIVLLNEYARTKYCGEVFTLLAPNSLVVRTNIIGFRNSNQPTFLEWVINSLKNQSPMTLFDDYFTSSITVTQFSNIFYDLLSYDPYGVYNLASSQVFSKKEIIESIARTLNFSLSNTKIGSVKSLSQAPRANSIGLDVSKLENLIKYKLPNLHEVVTQIKQELTNV